MRAALSRGESGTPTASLHQLNTILLEATAVTFPQKSKARADHRIDFGPIWQLRDTLRRHWRRDLQGLFRAWLMSHRLARMARDARRRHVELRRDRVSNILKATQTAAEEHLPHKVYQLVSQLKPWSPRPRPRLKSTHGELLTASGEHERLLSCCRETFAPMLPALALLASTCQLLTGRSTWARHV